MDDIIRKAKERIAALIAERTELESLVAAYTQLQVKFGGAEEIQQQKRIRIPNLSSAIREILLENGKPMLLEPLFDSWCYRYPLESKNVTQRSFGKRLWTIRKEIKFIEGEGYWPVDPPSDEGDQEPLEPLPSWVPSAPVEPAAPLPIVVQPVQTIARRMVEPLDHYSVLAEDCSCNMCEDWRDKRDLLNKATAKVLQHSKGYGVSCDCADCKAMWKARTAFMAVENKRNLVSEIAYHVEHNREFNRHGQMIMDRLRGELDDPKRTMNWWADSGGKYPLGFWFRKVCVIASGMVSGAVTAVVVASGARREARMAVA